MRPEKAKTLRHAGDTKRGLDLNHRTQAQISEGIGTRYPASPMKIISSFLHADCRQKPKAWHATLVIRRLHQQLQSPERNREVTATTGNHDADKQFDGDGRAIFFQRPYSGEWFAAPPAGYRSSPAWEPARTTEVTEIAQTHVQPRPNR